jgi:hypothetical protein
MEAGVVVGAEVGSGSAELARQRTTPATTQHANRRCGGSGVVDSGKCDDGVFKLDPVSVVAEAAVLERKAVRRVRPLLSELQVPEWQELAADRGKWRNMLKSIDIV